MGVEDRLRAVEQEGLGYGGLQPEAAQARASQAGLTLAPPAVDLTRDRPERGVGRIAAADRGGGGRANAGPTTAPLGWRDDGLEAARALGDGGARRGIPLRYTEGGSAVQRGSREGAAPRGGAAAPRTDRRRDQHVDPRNDKKRDNVLRLENEVQELEMMVGERQTAYACVQSTGIQQLLKHDRPLVQDMISTNERINAALAEVAAQLGACGADPTPEQLDSLMEAVAECVKSLKQMSEHRIRATQHGAAMVVMHDGLMMTHPALLSATGDFSMASWLLVFLHSGCDGFGPELVAELMQLLRSWKAFEDDIAAQVGAWLSSVQQAGIAQVQAEMAAKIEHIVASEAAASASHASRRERAREGQEEHHAFDLQAALTDTSLIKKPPTPPPAPAPAAPVPPQMQQCHSIIEQNERFRCLALEKLEPLLSPVSFANFLHTRLKLNESIALLEGHLQGPQTTGVDELLAAAAAADRQA